MATFDPPIIEYAPAPGQPGGDFVDTRPPSERTGKTARGVIRLPQSVSALPLPSQPSIVLVGQQPSQAYQLTTTQILIGALLLYFLLKN